MVTPRTPLLPNQNARESALPVSRVSFSERLAEFHVMLDPEVPDPMSRVAKREWYVREPGVAEPGGSRETEVEREQLQIHFTL